MRRLLVVLAVITCLYPARIRADDQVSQTIFPGSVVAWIDREVVPEHGSGLMELMILDESGVQRMWQVTVQGNLVVLHIAAAEIMPFLVDPQGDVLRNNVRYASLLASQVVAFAPAGVVSGLFNMNLSTLPEGRDQSIELTVTVGMAP